MKYLVYIGVLTVFCTTSCKKDQIPVEGESHSISECDCTPIPEIQGPNTGYTYVEDTVYDFFPQYNPNNSEEILYCTFNGMGGVDMNKYDRLTNQKTVLYSGPMSYAPNWGKNDWILFDKSDGQVWKMKSNGDSLSLATVGGAFFHPKWNESGDRFMTFQGGVNNSQYHNGKVWALNGTLTDSIDIVYGNGDWRFQGKFGYINGYGIRIYDIDSNAIVGALNSSPTVTYNGINWIGQNEAIVTSTDGIYHYNVSSNSLTLIKCTCDSRLYVQATVNNNGTTIIFTEITLTPINSHILLARRQLVEMDVNNGNMTALDLP